MRPLLRAVLDKLSAVVVFNLTYAVARPHLSPEGVVVRREFRGWTEFERFMEDETREFPNDELLEQEPTRLAAFWRAVQYNNFVDVIHRVDVTGTNKKRGYHMVQAPMGETRYMYEPPSDRGRRFHTTDTMLAFMKLYRSHLKVWENCGFKKNLPRLKRIFDKYQGATNHETKVWRQPTIGVEYRPGLDWRTVWVAAFRDVLIYCNSRRG